MTRRASGRRAWPGWLALGGAVLIVALLVWLASSSPDREPPAALPVAADDQLGAPPDAPRSPSPTEPDVTPLVEATPVVPEGAPTAAGAGALEIVVVDTRGTPIGGAYIHAPGRPPLASSAEDGRAALAAPWPPAVTVAAYDFCPLELELPAASAAASPVRAVLTRTSSLDVLVLDAAGRPMPKASVRIEFGAPVFAPDIRLIPPSPQTSHAFATDADGRCLITRLLPQVPFLVKFEDRYGIVQAPAKQYSLAPEERRFHRFDMPCAARSVVVHVRDASGAPVAGAAVELAARCDSGSSMFAGGGGGHTDEGGRAVFESLCATWASPRVVKEGFGMAWHAGTPLTSETTTLDLTLGPSHTVDVAIVDAAGRPQRVDRVLARLGGDLDLIVYAEDVGDGRYRLTGLPAGEVTLLAVRLNQTWTQSHDARVGRASIVVPIPGSLDVQWKLASPRRGRVQLRLRPIDSAGQPGKAEFVSINIDPQRTQGLRRIDMLMPDAYEVCLVDQGESLEWVPISPPTRVTIVADEVASVRLGP